MTLKQIDERLALFPQYLEYRLNNWQSTPWGQLYTLKTEGMLFICPLQDFDEWLYKNGHFKLTNFGFENTLHLNRVEHEESAWLKEYRAKYGFKIMRG